MNGTSALIALFAGMAIKGALVLAAATVAAFLLRRRSAAVRHASWWIVLVALLLMPAVSSVLPVWEMPGVSRLVPAVAHDTSEPAQPDAAVPRTTAGREIGGHGIAEGEAPAQAGREDRSEIRAREAGHSMEAWAYDAAAVDAAGEVSRPAGGSGVLGLGALGLWALGASFVLWRVIAERRRLSSLARRSRPAPRSGRAATMTRRLAPRLGLTRPPRLRLGRPGTMPMTWGARRPVILLPEEAESWAEPRLEAVVLHELAHVRRRDYLTQVVGTVACALHWFDPLAWLALRRLRAEREHACDDEVLRAGSRPSGYAAELVSLARGLRAEPVRSMIALAMARPSALEGRVRAVLEANRERTRLTRALLARTAAVVALPVLPVAALGPAAEADAVRRIDAIGAEPRHDPERVSAGLTGVAALDPGIAAFQEAPPCTDPARAHSRSVSEREGRWTVTIRGDRGCVFDFELTGAVRFDETFSRIAWIGPGARLEIRAEEGGEPDRRLEIRGDDEGRPVVRYWRDGEEAAIDGDADAWIASALLPVLRLTGIAAEERTRFLLERGGVDAVLREVDLIGSDRVQSRYLLALADAAELDGRGLSRVLSAATESIGSDSRMSDFIVSLTARRPEVLVGGGVPGFADAIATVGSDSEHRVMLVRLLDRWGGDADVTGRLLDSARLHIGSDSEMRRLLLALAERHPAELEEARYWRAAETIGSDSEMRTVLNALAESETAGDRGLAPALEAAAAGIGSDSEMTTFLVRLVRTRPAAAAGAASGAFWRCVDTIGSDSEMSRALEALIDEAGDDARVLERALSAGRRGLGSDSEMARFLVRFAERHPTSATGPLLDAYLDAANTIGSRSERGRALAAVGGP